MPKQNGSAGPPLSSDVTDPTVRRELGAAKIATDEGRRLLDEVDGPEPLSFEGIEDEPTLKQAVEDLTRAIEKGPRSPMQSAPIVVPLQVVHERHSSAPPSSQRKRGAVFWITAATALIAAVGAAATSIAQCSAARSSHSPTIENHFHTAPAE